MQQAGLSPMVSGAIFYQLVAKHIVQEGYAKGKMNQKTGFIERRGKIQDLDRSFDLAFWQAQPPSARFMAAWELIVHASRVKGIDVRKLRLHRSTETFQRQQR